MLVRKIQFTKSKWYMKLPFMTPRELTVDDLKPVFTGYLAVHKFYHRQQTKLGHYVITPNGIGEIVKIIRPQDRQFLKETTYKVKLMDNVTASFVVKQLKYLVVYPTDFYEHRLPILLSFADYLYANPSGITDGIYTFRITSHGYAMMTDKTRDILKINKLLTKYENGRQILKTITKHNYQITKKEKSHHVKRNHI